MDKKRKIIIIIIKILSKITIKILKRRNNLMLIQMKNKLQGLVRKKIKKVNNSNKQFFYQEDLNDYKYFLSNKKIKYV